MRSGGASQQSRWHVTGGFALCRTLLGSECCPARRFESIRITDLIKKSYDRPPLTPALVCRGTSGMACPGTKTGVTRLTSSFTHVHFAAPGNGGRLFFCKPARLRSGGVHLPSAESWRGRGLTQRFTHLMSEERRKRLARSRKW